jgi:hypothetical protein
VVGSICRLAPIPTTSTRPKLAPKRLFTSSFRELGVVMFKFGNLRPKSSDNKFAQDTDRVDVIP